MSLLAASLTIAMSQTQGSSADPYANETPAQHNQRMKWFREARFGMFIHWGVYSVPAGTYNGKQIPGLGEWIMNDAHIPTDTYQDYAKQFNPTKYNADTWVKIAKEAGMKYIVITSKHHDGFAMFNSKTSPWNITQATPFKRDPLKELAAACKKYGVKLGFYYSQAQDWNHPGGAAAYGHWDTRQNGDMGEYIRNIAVPQVKEILTNYGDVACLWWDTPSGMTKEYAEELLPLLKLQPGIIHNNRLGGGYQGDTETPEQYVPATGYPGGRDWETCMTMNDTWGFKSFDNNWKSKESLIRNLIDIASKGGNYLLNVGPTSLGEIPPQSVDRLKAIGQWMHANGKAIYATTPSPFKRLAWGRCTKVTTGDETTLYLHVFDWPSNGKLLVPGLQNKVQSASLLVGNKKILTTLSSDGVTISVPAKPENQYSTTLVLKVSGPLKITTPEIVQASNGNIDLKPGDAKLHGSNIAVEGPADNENFGFWTNANDWIEWGFRVKKPGTYRLSAEIASMGTGKFQVDCGGQIMTIVAPNTGGYQNFKLVEFGTATFSTPTKAFVLVKPIPGGWQPINMRAIKIRRMTPSKGPAH
jgi:alpha-L-fucosidase